MEEPPDTGETGTTALDLAVDGANLAGMRRHVAARLDGLAEDLVQDVELVCTELAANACDHAEGPHRLVLHRQDTQILVEVHDGSPHREPTVGSSTLGPHRGHGMRMVESLCRAWGVRRGAAGKTVWAVVPIA
ncbi:hypothetical protein GCM10022243_30050 [Saccharothrix violaceirubra]